MKFWFHLSSMRTEAALYRAETLQMLSRRCQQPTLASNRYKAVTTESQRRSAIKTLCQKIQSDLRKLITVIVVSVQPDWPLCVEPISQQSSHWGEIILSCCQYKQILLQMFASTCLVSRQPCIFLEEKQPPHKCKEYVLVQLKRLKSHLLSKLDLYHFGLRLLDQTIPPPSKKRNSKAA